jgi:hypothetical protein
VIGRSGHRVIETSVTLAPITAGDEKRNTKQRFCLQIGVKSAMLEAVRPASGGGGESSTEYLVFST